MPENGIASSSFAVLAMTHSVILKPQAEGYGDLKAMKFGTAMKVNRREERRQTSFVSKRGHPLHGLEKQMPLSF
jgi:hypothetical protein